MLFDSKLTFSYVSTYFGLDFDIVIEHLAKPILVSTFVGDSLVVKQMYQSCIVTFSWHKT